MGAEFWQRYVLWCEGAQPDVAAAVLARAATVFCKRRPDFCTFAARFYEGHGQSDAAREMYHHLLSAVTPGLLEVRTGRVGPGIGSDGCGAARCQV